METADETLAAEGIYPPGSPQVARFESDVARFLGREYARIAAGPAPTPLVGDQGPMWCETDALMARHYDADLNLFKAFLDRRYMAYSMAYYGETPEAIRTSQASLEQAQDAKLALVTERAGLQGDESILDIGCGFGPLETYLADRFPNASMTAVTPSGTQAGHIRDCIRRPEHPLARAQVQLVVGDFASLPLEPGNYDVVISVGAFEHVQNLGAAMGRIRTMLRPGGICLLHYICSRLAIPRLLDSRRTLVNRYFPGGKIWPFSALAAHTAGLDLEEAWFVSGLNYWRTLDSWHRNLWDRLPDAFGTPRCSDALRHWNQFFSLCKSCFAPSEGQMLGVGQFRLRKPH
jgi:cyclopropane-fatty-acyl-phospholipid synthase